MMNKPTTRSAFPLYIHDMERAVKFLSAEEGWALMQALLKLSKGEEVEEESLTPVTQFAFSQMGEKLIRDAQRYDETCERNRQNAMKSRRKPSQEEAVCSQPKEKETVTEEEDENETVKVSEKETERERSACGRRERTHAQEAAFDVDDEGVTVLPFTPPTELEVREYAFSLGKQVDVRKFMDYNRSRGWRVGSAPMQDWRAALRNWLAKEEELKRAVIRQTLDHRQVNAQRYSQRQYTEEELRFNDDALMQEAVELARRGEI